MLIPISPRPTAAQMAQALAIVTEPDFAARLTEDQRRDAWVKLRRNPDFITRPRPTVRHWTASPGGAA